MKSDKLKYVIILIAVVILVVGGVFVFIRLNNVEPKKYYEKQLDNIALLFKNNVEKSKKNYIGTLSVKINTSDDGPFNNFGFNFKYGNDYERQKMRYDLTLNKNNKDLIEGTLYIANKKGYINIKDMLSGYYIDLKDYDEYLQQSVPQDMSSTIESAFNVLKDTLTDANYKKIRENNVEKVIVHIDEADYVDFVKSYINNLRNNQVFVNNVSKVTEKTNTKVREELSLMLDESYEPKNISITTSLKGGKATEMIIEESDSDYKFSIIINNINTNSFSYNATFLDKQSSKEKKYMGTVTFNISNDEDQLIISFGDQETTINVSNTINYGKDIIDLDTTNTKDIANISSTDILRMQMKLEANKDLMDFIKSILGDSFEMEDDLKYTND